MRQVKGTTYEGELGSTRTYYGRRNWVVVILRYISKEDKPGMIVSLKSTFGKRRKPILDFPLPVNGEFVFDARVPKYARNLFIKVMEKETA